MRAFPCNARRGRATDPPMRRSHGRAEIGPQGADSLLIIAKPSCVLWQQREVGKPSRCARTMDAAGVSGQEGTRIHLSTKQARRGVCCKCFVVCRLLCNWFRIHRHSSPSVQDSFSFLFPFLIFQVPGSNGYPACAWKKLRRPGGCLHAPSDTWQCTQVVGGAAHPDTQRQNACCKCCSALPP